MNAGKRILLVEDEAITALTEKRELEKYGYTVSTVSSGEEAISKINSDSSFDLILMDINLGQGIDGTKAARKILHNHDIPLIFLSSHTDPDIVELTERITSYGYVVKQTGITVLDASIKMAFRLHNEKQRVQDHQREAVAANEELNAALEELEAGNEELYATNEQLIQFQNELLIREEALKASESRYRSLHDSMHEGICLHKIEYDNDGRPVDYTIIDTNPRYEEILNIEKSNILNKRASDIYESPHPPYLDIYSRVTKTGEPEKFETYFPLMKKYFLISVFSPAEGQFATIFEDITERKNMETALRESEQKYRTYVENAPEAIFIANEKGEYIDVNNAASQMTGYSKTELLNMSIPELASPEFKSLESFSRLKTEGRFSSEIILRKKNGTDFHCTLSAVVLTEDRFLGFCADISERKTMETALTESEKRFRMLVENLHEGVIIYNTDATVIFSNQRATEILELPPEKINYMKAESPLWTLIRDDGSVLPPAEYPVSRVLSAKQSFSALTIGIQKPEGKKSTWVLVNGYPLFDDRKNLSHAVITFTDITKIKTTEENLQQKHRDLARSQEIASVGTWKWDLSDNTIEWSDEMYSLYGLNPHQPPSPERVRELILPEDRQIYDLAMESLTSGKIPKEINYRIQKKNGEIRTMVVQAEYMTSVSGANTHLVGIVQDVTDYVRSRDEIEKLLTEKEMLIREVHHRIKNDMNTIRSLIMLQAEQSNNHEAKEILKEAENRIILMGNIYNTLYQSKSISSININQLLHDLISNLKLINTLSRRVTVETDIVSMQVSPRDSFPIGIIVNELVSNAFKYAFEETENAEICISVQQKEKDLLEISVSDNGVGIPDGIIHNKDYGFGLILVKSLAQQFRGDMKIIKNSGTKIVVSIYAVPLTPSL